MQTLSVDDTYLSGKAVDIKGGRPLPLNYVSPRKLGAKATLGDNGAPSLTPLSFLKVLQQMLDAFMAEMPWFGEGFQARDVEESPKSMKGFFLMIEDVRNTVMVIGQIKDLF